MNPQGRVHRPRPKQRIETLCAQCIQPVDLMALWQAQAKGEEYAHPPCGRILVRGVDKPST